MSSKVDISDETSQDTGPKSKQQQQSAIPQIEVVNEIQIIVNKKDKQRNLTAPSDSKDIKKCLSSRSSKTDLTAVTTQTTTTLETTTKRVSIKNGQKSNDKDKSDSSICVCGKLLKRVKSLLEKKEKGGEGE